MERFYNVVHAANVHKNAQVQIKVQHRDSYKESLNFTYLRALVLSFFLFTYPPNTNLKK